MVAIIKEIGKMEYRMDKAKSIFQMTDTKKVSSKIMN